MQVLICSNELQAKYGEPAVTVTYRVGEGEVFHMISHYYLQRTETRSRRHRQSAAAYAAEKDLPVDSALVGQMSDLNLSEVESAASSARLFANIAAAKKRGVRAAEDAKSSSGNQQT